MRRRTRRAWTAGAIAVGLIATGSAYYVIGWHHMETACTRDDAVPDGADGGSAAFGWSWAPIGFTCTWDGAGDTVSVTKLWWS